MNGHIINEISFSKHLSLESISFISSHKMVARSIILHISSIKLHLLYKAIFNCEVWTWQQWKRHKRILGSYEINVLSSMFDSICLNLLCDHLEFPCYSNTHWAIFPPFSCFFFSLLITFSYISFSFDMTNWFSLVEPYIGLSMLDVHRQICLHVSLLF